MIRLRNRRPHPVVVVLPSGERVDVKAHGIVSVPGDVAVWLLADERAWRPA